MKKLILTMLALSLFSVAQAAECQKNEKKISIGEHYTDANYDSDFKKIKLLASQGRLTIVMRQDHHFVIDESPLDEVLDLNGSVKMKFKKLKAKDINVKGYTLKAGTRLPITELSKTDYRKNFFKEIADLYNVKSDLPVSGFYIYMDRLALDQAPFIICGAR